MYELIIIGAGPAGLTAAIYAARKRVNTLVLTKEVGGQALWSSEVENYLGFKIVTGEHLVSKFRSHLEGYDVLLKEGVIVTNIEKKDNIFIVHTKNEVYESRAVIISSGKVPKRLNITGETTFLGHGLAYCATCDAPLFSDMNVAVIGGGNSALDAALQLTKIAKKIYLITVNDDIYGEEVVKEKVLSANNLELLTFTQTDEVLGDQFITQLKVTNIKTNESRFLDVSGVFIEIGSIPSTSFCKDLVKLNDRNEIIVNCETKTNVSGLFAAGDVSNVPDKQIIIAAGEGSKAALSAYRYLTNQKIESDCN